MELLLITSTAKMVSKTWGQHGYLRTWLQRCWFPWRHGQRLSGCMFTADDRTWDDFAHPRCNKLWNPRMTWNAENKRARRPINKNRTQARAKKQRKDITGSYTRGLFLESPETLQEHFGWHDSLCVFKTKASRGTKLRSYFNFYSLYNIWKDQLYRISGLEFDEWVFGPE